MTRRRVPIRPLIALSVAAIRATSAFSVADADLAASCRRRQIALFVGDGETRIEDDNIQAQSTGERDYLISRVERQRSSRRRRRTDHHETRTTAAGAESLFSSSLWSIFSKSTFTRRSWRYEEISYVDAADLPTVDCEWACHSNEETIKLQRMKLLLTSELQAVVENKLHEVYPDVYSDLRLLRFLRKSKERDVPSAVERYQSFLKWREENNVDDIREMVESGRGTSFEPPSDRLQRVASYFPMDFEYITKFTANPPERSGVGSNSVHPAAILYAGSFDTPGISERIASTESSITLDDFLEYWIYLYESIHHQLYQQSIQNGEMMFLDEVGDLSGLSIQQFSPYFVTKIMKPWLRMTQAYYPETTRRIYVLNPPGIVKLAWNLVTPLLSQGTVDKIRFEKKFKGTAKEFCEGRED